MQDKSEINVGVLIKSIMKKVQNHQGRRYGFSGLLTKLLRSHNTEEEALDYKPQLERRPVDVTRTRALDVSRGPIATLAEQYA